MRWDGIGASLKDVEAGHVAEMLTADLGGMLVRGKPRRRYGTVLDVEVAGRQAAWVGFDEGNGSVYVEGKGETSPDLVGAIRRRWPEHSCARLDACEDYSAPGAFVRLQEAVRRAAMAPTKGGSMPLLGYSALPDDPVKGATWGSLRRGGVAYVRLYEPGKMPDRAHWGPDAVRIEGEFRPHSALEKRAAASMSPVDVWGLTGWTHRVGEALGMVDLPRFQAPSTVYTQAKTTLYLARSFRRHWEEMLRDFGDWECIGRELSEVWRLDDLVKSELDKFVK